MYVRTQTGRDKVTRVYTVEGYRDERGRSRQRTVISHGRLDVLQAAEPNVLERLRAEAAVLTEDRNARLVDLRVDLAEPSDGAVLVNVGWWLVEGLLERLGVGEVARRAKQANRWRIDVAGMLKTLVAARIVEPCSKLATVEQVAPVMAGAPALGVGQVYQGLDHIAEISEALQRRASTRLKRGTQALAVVDYDVTNYFFHVDFDDDPANGAEAPRGTAGRVRGHCKEGRPDPIVQMGLFLDGNGLPISFRLFHGNVPDSKTLPVALGDFKHAFGTQKVIVVADKAMNNRDSLGALEQHADGWIVSISARGNKELADWVTDQTEYDPEENPGGWRIDKQTGMRVKSITRTRDVPVTEWGVAGLPKIVEEKLVATWSPDAAKRDRFTRTQILAKAARRAGKPSEYKASLRKGVNKYITAQAIVPTTGEILEPVLILDTEAAERESWLDGYQIIATNQTSMPDVEVINRYRQLWRIEETFRISKTNLKTRPVYLRTTAHIEAHFTICFLALLATRILEKATGLPVAQMLDAIRALGIIDTEQGIQRVIRPETWNHIDTALHLDTNKKWATWPQLRQWRATMKQAKWFTTFQNIEK
jgi:hypothetical protein